MSACQVAVAAAASCRCAARSRAGSARRGGRSLRTAAAGDKDGARLLCALFRPPSARVNHRELAERFLDLRSRDPAWLPRATCLRHAPRPLVIEPKKRLKSEENSRFRAKP